MEKHLPAWFVSAEALAAALAILLPTCAQAEETLRESRDVLGLSPEAAKRGLPVILRGVVTYIKPEGIPDLVLQDETGGIFINDAPRPPPSGLRPGAYIELKGRTAHVEFSPTVRYESAEVLGNRPLPVPLGVTLDELQSARYHCQYVEVAGVVRSVQRDPNLTPARLLLKLATPSGSLDVWVLRFESGEQQPLVDARVRVRGVCLHWTNFRGQPISLRLLVNSLEAIRIESEGRSDPFAAPLLPLNGMLQYRPDGLDQHRIRIRGVVTLHQPGEAMVIQKGTLASRLRLTLTGNAAVGDEVEAAGFVGKTLNSVELHEAVFRVVGHPGAPAPLEIAAGELPKALKTDDLDQRLVKWNATVTDLQRSDDLLTLQLEMGNYRHEAWLKNPPPLLPRSLRPGSRVELVGIAEAKMNERGFIRSRTADLSGLTLRDLGDIRVLNAGPWLTVRTLVLLVGVAAGLLVVTLLWVVTLRRRVEKRTALLAREIRARHDAEVEFNAALAERARLGAELHDTLEQSLTGLSLQLQAAELVPEDRLAESRDYLRSARELLDQSRNELRSSLGRLRVSRGPPSDLVADLREMAKPMTLGTHRSIVVEGSCPAGAVPELVAHHTLRIAQESLTNAVKHSGARNIRIVLERGGKNLSLQVTDDGTGFRPGESANPNSGHYGIMGMRERVQKLGGSIEIRSAPGAGTTVDARLPLTPLFNSHERLIGSS